MNDHSSPDLSASLTPPSVGQYKPGMNLALTNEELRTELDRTLERMTYLERRFEEQSEAVVIDYLTGMYNRRYFEKEFEKIHAESERGVGYAMIILDLDHFNAINQTYGHPAGDEVLKIISKTLGTGRRREDRIIRWGGDEFVIILPRCSSLEYATTIAEKVRGAIEDSVCMYDGHGLKVTASLGAAFAPPLNAEDSQKSDLSERAANFFKNADAALYAAKGMAAQQFPIFIGPDPLGGNAVAVWNPRKGRPVVVWPRHLSTDIVLPTPEPALAPPARKRHKKPWALPSRLSWKKPH